MRVRALAAVAVVAALAPLGVASAANAAPGDVQIAVVHGIALPSVATVDVYVDGELALPDVAYGEVQALAVPPASYSVVIAAGDSVDASAPILQGTFNVTGDVSLVAQLDALGTPQLKAYPDDLSPTNAGEARVIVRHAAQAPTVSVEANGLTAIDALTNGQSVKLDVPAGVYSFVVKAGGVAVPGLSLSEVSIEAGNVYIVYATGGGAQAYAPIVDSVPVGQKPAPTATTAPATTTVPATTTRPAVPTAVPAGDGSAGWSGPLGVPALIAIAMAAALALAVGFALRGNSARR